MDCIFKTLSGTCDGCSWYDGEKCNLQGVKEKQSDLTLKKVLGDPDELGGEDG